MAPMRRFFLLTCGFGITMGLIFPLYASFFVEWLPGRFIPFVIGCLLAGIMVGLFGYYSVRTVVRRIDEFTQQSLKATLNISVLDTGSEKDQLLRMEKSFLDLLNRFSTVLRGETREVSSALLDDAQRLEILASDLKQGSAATATAVQTLQTSLDILVSSVDRTGKSLRRVEKLSTAISKNAESVSANTETARMRASDMRAAGQEQAIAAQTRYQQVRSELDAAIAQSAVIGKTGALVDRILAINSQTRLLAINTGIEASRAGVAGAGFRVIAGEIGNLAAISSESAKDIQSTINLVNQSLADLLSSIGRLTDLMDGEIMHAFEQFTHTFTYYGTDAAYYESSAAEFKNVFTQLEKLIEAVSVEHQTVIAAVEQNARALDIVSEQTLSIQKEAGLVTEKARTGLEISQRLQLLIQ